MSPEDEIRAVARMFSDQPVQNPDPGVWAVLTAISKNARQRPQGMNILLSADEHCLGRCVEDTRFQIGALAVSAKHCRIFRDRIAAADGGLDPNLPVPVFLKDTSTNGTYRNWTRLRKHSSQVRLQHGDIISFIAPPHDDNSYAFVYREVQKTTSLANGAVLKRKSEDVVAESKRLKGIGLGAPDGPVSLDDVRSLQRSNTELRQQLESHVLTIENLRSENRASIARHENEMKELKEAVSNSFLDQIKELQHVLDEQQKEVEMLNTLSAELRNSVKDLNERLSASMQSRVDADEIIQSQKATISELESQLDEERNLRREEREKAAADLKSALHKAHSEAQEEIKRQADVYTRQHKEQQEVISKLQESEKESRLLVETLRSKLEDARESLVMSEKKVRQLEVQVQDEQLTLANCRKKSEMLESELKGLKKELESEKVAREEAWAKVSALELEIAAAIRDLSIEKQRFQGARERIILRETQLRAFYSTTEEITALFAKQQEQLKAMQKTLEDEDNYDNASIGIDLNEPALRNVNVAFVSQREEAAQPSNKTREASGASTPKNAQTMNDSSDDDASTTEKHDCDLGSQDGNTQDLECTNADRLVKEFGPDMYGVSPAVVPDGEPTDTERVLGTESQAGDACLDERNTALQECGNLGGDTMQLDDEAQVQENTQPTGKLEGLIGGCSKSRLEDAETGTIRTADLLASEVAGSWAVSTAPSVNGENESPWSMGDPGAGGEDAGTAAATAALLAGSDGQAARSQRNGVDAIPKLRKEHQVLNAMIEIIAPDFRKQFQGGRGGEKNESMSDAETEGSNNGDASNSNTEDASEDGAADDDNEVMIEDSVG
ncbi:myosin-7-like isoform X2 [Phoenix dactylifera]|uniref:Myosin-7-like isoform X2 n=1 Tax=Phoenix dactylifera TaxID=42345 RepID=A0A8B7BL37_PHODC|nr:myosin-7-like isoform X2 [Phoenix dactylifera]